MKIQFNTDKTIEGDERNEAYFNSLIESGLKHYDSNLSRIEVHLSDQNGTKEGPNDIQCIMEARIEGKQPIAVTSQANTIEMAVTGAIDKLENSLKTIFGRMKDHQK
ncbi:MAG: HPF/RaiA family ribosome-associated protein [Saprospiraceae bacterium]|nr:HPF/RaiA family ribosome-associated protein [Candidatus Brachybacter algidus]